MAQAQRIGVFHKDIEQVAINPRIHINVFGVAIDGVKGTWPCHHPRKLGHVIDEVIALGNGEDISLGIGDVDPTATAAIFIAGVIVVASQAEGVLVEVGAVNCPDIAACNFGGGVVGGFQTLHVYPVIASFHVFHQHINAIVIAGIYEGGVAVGVVVEVKLHKLGACAVHAHVFGQLMGKTVGNHVAVETAGGIQNPVRFGGHSEQAGFNFLGGVIVP